MDSIDEFYMYLDGFVGDIFENTTDKHLAQRSQEKLQPTDASNRLLGAIQIKQIRIAGEECAAGKSEMFSMYLFQEIFTTKSYNNIHSRFSFVDC